ncbi:hypothetical protein CEUSTIGMA_g1408.t1 [Chlamydomonas eustigma]|uniref:Gamma-tubulin complex component n=1 Tax=Chlamydomonas eustigma TaxID=1157962 RepID=A0A250WSZ5_9CHLO|nr:hypothetical protein CEUSTIGMA_g1408.t1 [Chlamydomonas eustigma]|eukprot:GAX73958.1 hypothetical protein CEUSTIGMA_g1408.t1 [Chlamydomonas eustigma]
MAINYHGYENLLQELLMALAGFSGDVFVEKAEGLMLSDEIPSLDQGAFELANDVSWVEDPDRTVLDSLARLGFHFKCISKFIDRESWISPILQQSRAGSLYCSSLASGLQELLDVYRAKLLEVQQLVLGPEPPVLSRLQYLLADFQVLLLESHKLVYEVHQLRQKDFKGCELIALLYCLSRCGAPILQSCMQRLLWHCNQVLLKQLSSWMVHGLLLDPYHESFISSGATSMGSEALQEQQVVAASVVNASALPTYISPEVADTILFIGKAVWLLRHPAGDLIGQDLLPSRDTLEFIEGMRHLQERESFQRVEFEHTVEAIRSKVSAVLWQLVVVRADLPGHLSAIKDYFLLAKGDFFHNFLVEAKSVMSMPPRPGSAEADISIPFHHSAHRSTAQHDKLFQQFHIRWNPPQEGKGGMQRLDGWDSLSLEYEVEWPLGLLLSPSVMSRYNLMFQFLLLLKRVQLKLEVSWQSLHSLSTHRARQLSNVRGEDESSSLSHLRALHHVRQHMSHLVTNLQIYIQELSLLVESVVRVIRSERPVSDLEQVLDKLPAISNNFSTSVNHLYTYLQSSRLQDANKAPHLRQLYLRLNFNGYVGGSMTQRLLQT